MEREPGANERAVADHLRTSGWMPIGTAPMGGLLILGSTEHAVLSFGTLGHGGWRARNGRGLKESYTHWAYPPASPFHLKAMLPK